MTYDSFLKELVRDPETCTFSAVNLLRPCRYTYRRHIKSYRYFKISMAFVQ